MREGRKSTVGVDPIWIGARVRARAAGVGALAGEARRRRGRGAVAGERQGRARSAWCGTTEMEAAGTETGSGATTPANGGLVGGAGLRRRRKKEARGGGGASGSGGPDAGLAGPRACAVAGATWQGVCGWRRRRVSSGRRRTRPAARRNGLGFRGSGISEGGRSFIGRGS